MSRRLLQESGGIRDGSPEDRPIKGMTKKDPLEEGTNAIVPATRPMGQHPDEVLDLW